MSDLQKLYQQHFENAISCYHFIFLSFFSLSKKGELGVILNENMYVSLFWCIKKYSNAIDTCTLV